MSSEQFLSPDFPNAEAQRRYYLRLLGISSFYPRFILPGAMPSIVHEQQEHARALVVEEVSQGSEELVQREVKSMGPADVLASVKAPARPAPSKADGHTPVLVAKVARGSAESASLQFQLVLLQTDSGLAICNQIPALAHKGMSDREFKLLGNILHWLGCPLRSGFAQRRFQWPLPGLAGADRQQAGRSLQGFLDQAHKELAFTQLLMMGNSGSDCLHAFRETVGITSHPWQQFACRSLAEMLALPQLKHEAWQQLLPLRALFAKRST